MEISSKCTICFVPSDTWRYGALACNACAIFFNRQVKKKSHFICDSACLLENRDCYDKNRCRSCRLKLCFEVGMSEDTILLNAECRKLSIANRNVMKLEEKEGEDYEQETMLLNPSLPEVVIDRVILNLRKIENAFNRIRFSKFNPLTTSICSLNEALEGPSKLSIEYGEMSNWPLPYTKGYTDVIGDSFEENVKMRIIAGLDPNKFTGSRKSWYFCNVVYALEYFKAFEVFGLLSSSAKRILAGKMALLCANFSNYYYSMKSRRIESMSDTDAIVNPDGTAPFEGMETVFSTQYEAAVSCIQTLRSLNIDDNEYALMKVLLILSPDLEDASVSERAILTAHSESYAKILFSYVMARLGRDHGPRKYQEMLSFIDTINHRTKLERDLQVLMGALGLYRRHHCPLLEEIMLI